MIRLLSGDCRDVLATLPAESVQCVVTSPPYYGLRDYGTALWDGGDVGCDHVKAVYKPAVYANSRGEVGNGCSGWRGEQRNQSESFRDTCGKCGAVRVDRQIGLEATPDEYLATMVQVFRQIRRVMRNDAVAFINMGDSYADKQLQMIPARLAVALQADGWVLRSDIIWHKPNPMPESCRDRPTSAHEHVFMLTKAARYFYDADAVREPQTEGTIERWGERAAQRINPGTRVPSRGDYSQDRSGEQTFGCSPSGRNLRNVWTIATHAYPDAHFATFPPELAERCIKAGTSERGCCAACGKPWGRQMQASGGGIGKSWHDHSADAEKGNAARWIGEPSLKTYQRTTAGWWPSCTCDLLADLEHPADPVPCTVLDPFIGAGTTALVADRLQRDVIGIDLNTQYTRMAMDRCIADAPLLTAFPPAEPPEDERMADLFAGDEYERAPKARTTPRNDGNRWNENNGRGFMPRQAPDMAAD